MPRFNESMIDDKLIANNETMTNVIAPKAYCNKIHGYKLWKEGYVNKVKVKANVSALDQQLFLVKAKAYVSMKIIKEVFVFV